MALTSGTDKSRNGHNYTGIYYRYFAQIRHRKLKFMEIGVFTGASVKTWESYFPNAELHFIDVTDQYMFLSQTETDKQKLQEFASNISGQFDIIIDDGGHKNNEIITSFEVLFPFLNENGGVYVIEDLHTAYWNGFGGTGIMGNGSFIDTRPLSGSSINFLKDLVDEVNFLGAHTGLGSTKHIPPDLVRTYLNMLDTLNQFIFTIVFALSGRSHRI
ncbi:hypothetical protein Mgra_00007001 [Meloidogyne graminicola]|uniref:Class I SAM-dependent methyltransferase n=1 Tax=Meloidogyne graminicola TaxID=189291 RepID=A0A8S9ZJZ5_9BILA|nr:hypothetical protein Mgra_00007001 [Meloidogyne graminicola]